MANKSAVEQLCVNIWNFIDNERGVAFQGVYAAVEHILFQHFLEANRPMTIKEVEREVGLSEAKEYVELLEVAGILKRKLVSDQICWHADFNLWNDWYQNKIKQ